MTTAVFTLTGSGNFTVDPTWGSPVLQVDCTGGGVGGTGNNFFPAKGGGGGARARTNAYAATRGQVIPYSVAAGYVSPDGIAQGQGGHTWFGNSNPLLDACICFAEGGNAYGGGTTAGSKGDIKHKGGDGGHPSINGKGPGGGGAGSLSADGTDGASPTGGVTGGGDSGNPTGHAATAPGGGGGGGEGAGATGGAPGAGTLVVTVTYIPPRRKARVRVAKLPRYTSQDLTPAPTPAPSSAPGIEEPGALLLEDGTELLLEDGTPFLLED